MKDPGDRELGALRKLREVSSLLAAVSDPKGVVPLILDQAIALVGAERGFVILLGPRADADQIEVAAARNLDREKIERPEFKVSRSIVQRVARTGKAEKINDASEDPSTKDITSVQALNLRSILCVPLRAHGTTLGALYVDHRYLKGEFDAEDLATLEAFAVPAAISLADARRIAALEDARGELTRRVETIERLRAELQERYRERARELDRVKTEADRGLAAAEQPQDNARLGIVARSPAMKRVLAVLTKAAASNAPVLITGESGTGKELLARALHALSPRREKPFLAENCAALAESLLESELFGHEAGAFTGAQRRHIGIFEGSSGGTVFLDEVGEMAVSLQAKLLRTLQEKEIRRVGGEERVPVDMRIVAATNRDLEALVAQGQFRNDLFYRLNVVRIDVPPLRERLEDVPALLDHFLELSGREVGGVRMEPQTREHLLAYTWPGNVRELENEVRRLAVLTGKGGTIRPGLLSPAILGRRARAAGSTGAGESDIGPPLEGVWPLEALEREMVRRALRQAHGNKALAARLLGIPKSSLYSKLERLGLGEGEEPPPGTALPPGGTSPQG